MSKMIERINHQNLFVRLDFLKRATNLKKLFMNAA